MLRLECALSAGTRRVPDYLPRISPLDEE
jgi:hypothetical protein